MDKVKLVSGYFCILKQTRSHVPSCPAPPTKPLSASVPKVGGWAHVGRSDKTGGSSRLFMGAFISLQRFSNLQIKLSTVYFRDGALSPWFISC